MGHFWRKKSEVKSRWKGHFKEVLKNICKTKSQIPEKDMGWRNYTNWLEKKA